MNASSVSTWPATSSTSPNGLPSVATTRPSVTRAVVVPCSAASGIGRRSPPQTSTARGRNDSEMVRPGPKTSQSTASETSSTGTASTRCRRRTSSPSPRMASPVPAMMTMAAPLRSTQPRSVWPVTGDVAHDEGGHAEGGAGDGGHGGGEDEPAHVAEPAQRRHALAAPRDGFRRRARGDPRVGDARCRPSSRCSPRRARRPRRSGCRSAPARRSTSPRSRRRRPMRPRRLVVTRAQRAPTPAAGQNRARLVSGSTMRRPTTIASA